MDTFPNRSFRGSEAALAACIDRLLAGPRRPHKEFVIGRTTYAALYAMAAHLRATLGRDTDGPPVCLCAQDKAVMAAALLAALAGGRGAGRALRLYAPGARSIAAPDRFPNHGERSPRPVPAGPLPPTRAGR